MALKESNKNRKKKVEPTVEVYEPVIQTDSTIGWVFIICLVLAFFAAM